MDSSTDELFASLGGALMRDILADFQSDDDGGDAGWSLEQLEKELAHLEQEPESQSTAGVSTSAASLVVSAAQQQRGTKAAYGKPQEVDSEKPDAWSLALQNFTALAEQDFLAADSARKQQDQPPQPDLSQAEEYDAAEVPTLAPPPGLATTPQPQSMQILQDAAVAAQQLDSMSSPPPPMPPKHMPPTPHNSIVIPPPPAVAVPPQAPSNGGAAAVQGPPGLVAKPVQPVVMGSPPPSLVGQPVVPPPLMSHPPAMPVPVAMPSGGPAWQTPPPQPRPRVFCNPHPSAPPIEATELQSSCMKARDIAYIVHSILKPVLMAGVSETDYDLQLLIKTGTGGAPVRQSHADDVQHEMESRSKRSKEWSAQHATLGYVAKTNVARPRALIATTTPTADQTSDEHKQRANLWKARIYCDKGYQSYQALVEIWRASPPGAVPPEMQPHLLKLFKCLGISPEKSGTYQAESETLSLIFKLGKGRILVARVLENALLPPNAVQAFLPVALEVRLSMPVVAEEDATDDRLFHALLRIVRTLPNLSGEALLRSVQAVQTHSKASLSSMARMECLHALLSRGSIMAAQEDASEDFRKEWSKTETDFMNLLAGM